MKRRTLIILGVIVLVVIVAGVVVWQNMNARVAPSTVSVQTTTVQRGSLVATVNAAGNVSAIDQATLAFTKSGHVAQVNVQVGDTVKTGQVLMQLDPADLALALKTAQTNLASAQAGYDQTKTDLQFALRNAQGDVTNSKANLDSVKATNDQNPNSLIIAKAALDKATVTLQQAQGNYNKIAWRGDVSMTSEATALQTATIDYQTALATFNKTAATINDAALQAAQTSYNKAQVALEQAQRNLDTSLRTAQANLDKAQIAVDTAKTDLANASLTAPIDGVVSAVTFKTGDFAAGEATAITIVSLKRLQIKVPVAEVDMPKIKIGNTAQVTLDALTGKTYQAKVIIINPVGTITQGVVNYGVTLELTNLDGLVKPGMTANVNVVVEQRDNVLLLPLRAVRTQGNQKAVTVQYKGQSISTPVTVGLTNDQSAEILTGVQDGDVVVLNQTTTRQTNNIPGGGPGILFGR